jgi:hypothetical protein
MSARVVAPPRARGGGHADIRCVGGAPRSKTAGGDRPKALAQKTFVLTPLRVGPLKRDAGTIGGICSIA